MSKFQARLVHQMIVPQDAYLLNIHPWTDCINVTISISLHMCEK